MKINLEHKSSFQELASKLSDNRPRVGDEVKVIKGRKHKGKTGTVIRHQRDQYSDAFRYGDSSTHFVKECEGREGFIVLISPFDDTKSFWVKADYIEILTSN